jgi:hypothetical protein
MFARLLAAFALLTTSMLAADTKLVVSLSVAPGQPPAPIEQMKREVAATMRRAGFQVEWLNRGADAPDAPLLVVLSLDGICSPTLTGDESPAGVSLANTSIVDGRVLPFSTVACAPLSRTLGPALARQPGAIRDFQFGRAMARVVSHELYHVLAATTEHTHSGIARSCYSPADLLAERFDFEPAVLARLHPTTEEIADEPSGR